MPNVQREQPRKLRLCILLPAHWDANLGGAEDQARMLVERVVEQGLFDVHYLARAVPARFSGGGYALHQIASGSRVAGAFFPDTRRLWQHLVRLQPDVIYQRVGRAYTGVAAYYARKFSKRMVWHVANDPDVLPFRWGWRLNAPFQRIDKAMLDYGIRNAHAIVVQSRQQGEMLMRHYGRRPTAYIPNFHPLPATLPAKPEGQMTVCWIANIKDSKRPEYFVRLASDYRQESSIRFVMVGRPPDRDDRWGRLKKQIEELPNLQFLGQKSQSEVNSLLERAHLLVNTSTHEGFPNTFIQAWMRRVPVVSMTVNPDQLLAEDGLGLCAEGSYDALREQVSALLSCRDRRMEMGLRAEEYARGTFSIRNIDDLIELLYGGDSQSDRTPTDVVVAP